MTTPKHLTLEEIGKLAGVSRSTVSRVLNDHPDVREEVRTRVESVIDETGYLPNHAARALVSNRSGLIGLVMLAEVDELFGDPYYSALVRGIHEGCAEQGSIFSIFPLYGAEGSANVLTRVIAHGVVDGVIVTAGPRSDHLITSLRDRGKRMVVVGHPNDDRDIIRVDVDNRGGSAAAVMHLRELGRRRIGFIGPTREYLFGAERLDGYGDALGAAGRDAALVRLEAPTAEGGYRAASALLAVRPDALHVATDTMADGVFRALREHDLRVPDDVAIVGFDGLPRGPHTDPPLTTVVQPVLEVGRTAVGLLSADVAAPHTVVLPTHLRVGGSCGAGAVQ